MAVLATLLLRLRTDRRGASVVEFALMAPVCLTLMFGLLDLGRLGLLMASLNYAVQEGAQHASRRGAGSIAPAGVDEVRAYVRARIFGVSPDAVDVTVNPPPSSTGAGSTVTVAAMHEFAFLANLVPLPRIRLTGTSTMVVL